MKPQIALTPDQMAELKTLGLDCSDASMAWKIKGEAKPRLMVAINFFEEVKQNIHTFGYTPAYTLEDILMKLPNTLEVVTPDFSSIIYYDLVIFPHWKSGSWRIKYKNRLGDLKSVTAKDIIKCAFEMLKWVLKNHPYKIKKI